MIELELVQTGRKLKKFLLIGALELVAGACTENPEDGEGEVSHQSYRTLVSIKSVPIGESVKGSVEAEIPEGDGDPEMGSWPTPPAEDYLPWIVQPRTLPLLLESWSVDTPETQTTSLEVKTRRPGVRGVTGSSASS